MQLLAFSHPFTLFSSRGVLRLIQLSKKPCQKKLLYKVIKKAIKSYGNSCHPKTSSCFCQLVTEEVSWDSVSKGVTKTLPPQGKFITTVQQS